MWRLSLLALAFLILCPFAFSQSTVTSGQITDAGSQAWSNGTYSFVFSPNPNYPVGPYTWTGGTLNTTISGSLNATGGYSVSIPSNSAISPQGSKWTATFCPQASSPCFVVNSVTVTGGTQTLNATPPAILISLQDASPPVLAYSTSEVTGAGIGSQFYLLGTGGGLQVCTVASGNSCTTWVSASGGATQSQPLLAVSFGPSCASGASQCFYTPANVKQDYKASWSTGAATVTTTDSPFTTCPTGQQIMGWNANANQAFTSAANPGGAISNTAAVTILSCTGANTANLSATPANTSTANAVITFGNTDDAGAVSLDSFLASASTCPKVMYQAQSYFFSAPHHYTQPPACGNLAVNNNSTLGEVFLPAGLFIEGRGRGNTIVYITPDFPGAGACNHGTSAVACFVRVIEGEWQDLQFNGSGNMAAPNLIGKALIEADGPGGIRNFTCVNIAGNQTANNSVGIWMYQGWDRWVEVDNSGCGMIGVEISTLGAGSVTGFSAIRLVVENSVQNALLVNSTQPALPDFIPMVACWDCKFMQAQPQPANAGITLQFIVNNSGGTVNFSDTQVMTNFTSSTVEGVGYFVPGSTTNAVLNAERSVFTLVNTASGSSTANRALSCNAAGNQINMRDSLITTQASGYLYEDLQGCLFRDQGNNSWGPSSTSGLGFNITNTAFTNANFAFSAEHPNFMKGACSGSLTASSTNGFSAPTNVVAACGTTVSAGVVVQGARTFDGLVCSVPTAGTTATTCNVLVNNAAPSPQPTCTIAASSNGCTDFTHHPALADGAVVTATLGAGAATTPVGARALAEWH